MWAGMGRAAIINNKAWRIDSTSKDVSFDVHMGIDDVI